MIVLSKTYIPYEQFDLDIILKVIAAFYILNLADLNGSKLIKLFLGVLLWASIGSTNIDSSRSM